MPSEDSSTANYSTASVLVRRSVPRTLINMALPMLAGTFALNAYGLTDAWFVAQLGTLPLAAMAFAIPVVSLMSCIAMGLGVGVTTLMSHALGRNDHAAATRLVSHGLVLIVLIALVMAAGGILSMDWVFSKLGADAETLPLIRGYMHIWYAGAAVMALPMMGNGLLIASGDSRSASRCMIVSPLINTLLNPVFIYGWMGLPAMGIRGSALATVVAQMVSTVWVVWVLHRRHHLVKLGRGLWQGIGQSWRKILAFGVPGMASMLLMPVANSVLTWILSGFGHEAVAASGAAGRIEMMAFIIPMALGLTLTPFVSQNYGAGRLDRIDQAFKLSVGFALIYGALVMGVFFVGVPWIARAFSEDARVVDVLTMYIRITAFGYGMNEAHRYCTFFLTGLHKPMQSLMLDLCRVIVLLIPLSLLGAHFLGLKGVFWGRLVSDLSAAIVGIVWIVWIYRRRLSGASQGSLTGQSLAKTNQI